MSVIEINKKEKRSYTKQIYLQLREKILTGRFECGERLPSTRRLSDSLGVSRNTVLTAYEMLESEGLAESKPGSGIYVSLLSENAAKERTRTEAAIQKAKREAQTAGAVPSLSAERIPAKTISFDSGIPDLENFPRGKWSRTVSRVFSEAPATVLGYDDPRGRPELRTAVASYLERTRGIRCEADRILITSGAKQGLTLIAKCFLDAQSEVVLEDPTNRNIRQIISYHTKRIIPVPVDREGVITDALPTDAEPALIFTTPSHQFPLGGILSLPRRLDLIRYAKSKNAFLVEDDYDSAFRYDGMPVRSLVELDGNRVLYVGTFSKDLFPSLRLGYLVLPRSQLDRFAEWKRLADHHSDSVNQLTLAQFIESGELERHVARMKKKYHKRRDILLALLEKHFPGRVSVFGEAAGMHIVAEFSDVVFTPAIVSELLSAGVYMVPVQEHSVLPGHSGQIILGYAGLDGEAMERGLLLLREIIEKY